MDSESLKNPLSTVLSFRFCPIAPFTELPPAQKIYFAANCNTLGLPSVLVIFPNWLGLAAVPAGVCRHRIGKVRMIEQIEGFSSQHQVLAFTNLELARETRY